ncbi:MAG: ATP-binding protein [Bacteroidales bacterium]
MNNKQGEHIDTGTLPENGSAWSILDQANIWIEIQDIRCRMIFFNRYAEKVSGFSRDLFLGNDSRWIKLFGKADTGIRLKRICHNLMLAGKDFSDKILVVQDSDGNERVFSWSMNLIKNQEHRVTGCMMVGTPVSGENSTWTEAWSRQEKYRSIFEHAPLGFFRSLPEGKFLEVNTTFARMLGFDQPEEVLDYVSHIGLDVYADPAFRKRILDQLQHSSEIKSFETSFRKKSGEKFHVRLNLRARFDKAMNCTVLDGTVEDISDRIKTAEINAVMLNIARSVNIVEDLDSLFENIRNELSRVIDTKNFFIALYDSDENTLSLPYFRDEKDSFDSFPAEKTVSSLVLKKKTSLLMKASDIDQLARNGEIEIVGTPAKVWLGIPLLVEGEVIGIMVLQNYDNENAFDHSDLEFLEVISPQISLSIKRKQSEQLLRESERQLRESNLTKDRFFNIIAHDLKNPFNAIIGFSTLLTDEWPEFQDNEKLMMIHSIRSSSEGAYELLMNLLEWSRLQVGKINFDAEFVDISTLIDLNFSLLKSNAEGKNIRLRKGATCERLVWVDPNMINTVLRNLISNAIKFTPKDGLILVECGKHPDYPESMVISVSDSGVGIPQDEIPDLFEITNSKTTTGTAGETGTGIGLVLCKEFVEKNNGKIWLESNPAKGTTFYVALPVRPTRKNL